MGYKFQSAITTIKLLSVFCCVMFVLAACGEDSPFNELFGEESSSSSKPKRKKGDDTVSTTESTSSSFGAQSNSSLSSQGTPSGSSQPFGNSFSNGNSSGGVTNTPQSQQFISNKYDGQYSLEFFRISVNANGEAVPQPIHVGLDSFSIDQGKATFSFLHQGQRTSISGEVNANGEISVQATIGSSPINVRGRIIENDTVAGTQVRGFVTGEYTYVDSSTSERINGVFRGVRYVDGGATVDSASVDNSQQSNSSNDLTNDFFTPTPSNNTTNGGNSSNSNTSSSNNKGLTQKPAPIKQGDVVSVHLSDSLGIRLVLNNSIKMTTFNTGLESQMVPFVNERHAKILDTLNVFDSDILCLQEVWDVSMRNELVNGLQSRFPHAYYFDPSSGNSSFEAGGRNGLLLLSKLAFEGTDFLDLADFSTKYRRGVLYAGVRDEQNTLLHLTCSHLSENLATAYDGRWDSWQNEQSLQVDQLINFTQRQAGNDPHLIMGHFGCSIENPPHVDPLFAENCQKFLNLGYSSPVIDQIGCSVCATNLVAAYSDADLRKNDYLMDHVFTNNFSSNQTQMTTQRVFTGTQVITVENLGLGVVEAPNAQDTVAQAQTSSNNNDDQQVVTRLFDGIYDITLLRQDYTREDNIRIEVTDGTFNSIIVTERIPEGLQIAGRIMERGQLFIQLLNSTLPFSASGSIDSTGKVHGTYFLGDTENSFFGVRIESGAGGNTNVFVKPSDFSAIVPHQLCARSSIFSGSALYCRPSVDGCDSRGILGFNFTKDPQIDENGMDVEEGNVSQFSTFTTCVSVCSALANQADPRSFSLAITLGLGYNFDICESEKLLDSVNNSSANNNNTTNNTNNGLSPNPVFKQSK